MDVREGEVHKPEDVTAPPVGAVRKRKSVVREYAEAIAIAILLALVIRTLIVQAFTIPSGSMMDTLLVGDYILVNKFLYGPELPVTDYRLPGLRDPHRGDIIVFKYPQDEKRDFIKRIVGLGRHRAGARAAVFINRRPLDEPYVRKNPTPIGHSATPSFCATPTRARRWSSPRLLLRHGDNRDNSQDSRYWGFVKRTRSRARPSHVLVEGTATALAAVVAPGDTSPSPPRRPGPGGGGVGDHEGSALTVRT